MFYPVKVNVALAAMAVPPNAFKGVWRSEIQQFGKAMGLTPQETAVLIVSHGMGMMFPDDVETAIMVWHQDRKLNASKPPVSEALSKMGFSLTYIQSLSN